VLRCRWNSAVSKHRFEKNQHRVLVTENNVGLFADNKIDIDKGMPWK
jgi:hypothetical protein